MTATPPTTEPAIAALSPTERPIEVWEGSVLLGSVEAWPTDVVVEVVVVVVGVVVDDGIVDFIVPGAVVVVTGGTVAALVGVKYICIGAGTEAVAQLNITKYDGFNGFSLISYLTQYGYLEAQNRTEPYLEEHEATLGQSPALKFTQRPYGPAYVVTDPLVPHAAL